jgi:hypothetical protein
MAITRRAVLDAVTGAGGVSEAFEPGAAAALAVYVQSWDGVTAGAVQLEEAPSKGSTVWAPVGAPLTALSGGPPNTYARRVIADGAVNYWRLNEKSGLAVVDSIGGVSGAVTGPVTLNQPGAGVDGDTAIAFADGGYIQNPFNAVVSGWKSFECWLRTSVGANGATNYTFFDDRHDGLNGRLLRLDGGVGNVALVPYIAGSPSSVASLRGGLFDQQWHHVVVNNVGATFEFFLDTVRDNFGAATVAGTSAVGARIGAPAQSFIGRIDELALYNAALTPAQVLAHYQLGLGTFAPPVVTGGLAAARVVVPKAVYGALRMRVTTPIVGGAVTAWVVAGDIPAEEAA